MPQEPKQYTSQENTLIDSLQHSPLNDNQRNELWNAYHHGTNEKEFVDNINKFDFNDDVKTSIYNLRFKGGYSGPNEGGVQALPQEHFDKIHAVAGLHVPPETHSAFWDKMVGTYYPQALAKISDVLNKPLSQTLFGTPSLQEAYGEELGGTTPPTSGGLSGMVADTRRTAAHIGLGIADFLQSPAGMATAVVGVALPGSGPWLASGFAASQAPAAHEAYKTYKANPTPENLQNALTQAAMIPAMAAGSKLKDVVAAETPAVRPGVVRGMKGFPEGEIPTPKGPEPTVPTSVSSVVKPMVNVEALIAPKPQEAVPSVSPAIKEAGLVDKGEIVKGSGVYQVEHPNHPGLTATVKGSDSIQDIKSKMADKLDAFAEKPTIVPGQPVQDPLKLSESAGKLRGVEPRAPDPAIEIAKQLREERQQVQLRQMREQAAPKTEPDIAVQPSHELPAQLQFRLNSLPDLERQVIEAGSEAQREKAQNRLVSTQTEIQKMTLDHVSKLNPEQLGQLKTQMETQGKIGLQQAEAIRNRVEQDTANREVVAPLRRELLPGGPVRKAIDPVTGERIAVREEQILRRGARDLLHVAMGEKPNTTPEDLIPYEKKAGESQEEHDAYLLRAQTKRVELRKEILNSIEIARDTGNSDDMGVVMDKLHDYDELEGLIGEYPEGSAVKGRRPKIDTTASLSTISLEESRRIMGRQVNKIPSHKEFLSRAQEFETRAGMSNRIANTVKKLIEVRAAKRQSEAGFVGEGKPSTYVTSPTAPSVVKEPIIVPPVKELLAKAEKLDLDVWKITTETPSSYKGWISPDGEHFIDSGPLDHADVSGRLLHNADMWGAEYRMLEEGWIRKAGTHDFETYKLTPTAINAIETSLIHDGNYGKEATIDYKEPHGLKTIHIDHGWEDLATDVRRAVREQGIGERGIGAVEPLTGAAIGGISGAAIGHAIGGMPGALLGGGIGWATGFATPAILRSPVFKQAYARMSPILADLKIPPMEWLRGKAQKPIVNPRMEDIIGAQHSDMQGPETSWQTRMALIPGDVLEKVHDRLLFVNDKPGALVRWAMRYDPRGAEFRGLQGRLTSEQSPYVAMRLAANRMAGMQVLNRIDYQNIFSEAHKSGLSNNLDEYLNLKAYSRAYQVLGERMQEHDATIKSAMSELENPEIDPRKKIVMEDAIAEARKEQKSILKRALKGEVVPAGYTVDSIRNDMRTMQENMEPQDFAKVEELAGKVFDINRQHLDMAHNSGIVSDADYQTYVARGNEYIPLHRIMSDMAASEYKTSGRSPMYLRQQNIIHALSGSERINRSPILASADANGSIVRESIRNQTVKKFLSLAEPDPKGVGKLFVEVGSNYKAKAGEALVGAYIDGKPVTYAVPDWMQSTLKHANPVSIDLAGNALLRFTKRLLQDTATGGNLAWSAGNAVRHFGDMALMSEAGLKSLKDFPKDVKDIPIQWIQSLKESVMKDPAWREYVRSGAAFSVFQRNITPEFFLNPQALGYTGKISRSLVLDSVKSFNAMVEDSTKLTTYKRMREAGYGETAAAYETSRYGGGPDFSRMGSATPALNLAFMFFNAHLQYVSRIAERVGEHPARMAAVLAGLTAMTMTLAQWNYQQKDSKGEDLLRKVPINDRENYTVILTGDTYTSHTGAEVPTYYKIAKPSLLKILVNPIENFVNKIVGRETRSGEQLGLDAINSIVPGQAQLREESLAKSAAQTVAASMNPLFRVPLEEGMNWQMVGGGRPIVPQRETGLAPEYQVSPSTPNVYRQMAYGGSRGALAGGAIGGTLGLLIGGPKGFFLAGAAGSAIGSMGISPRRIEHMASGFTAGVGQTAAGLTDIIARPPPLNKPFPFQGQEATRQIPGVGTLASRFIGSPVDQTERNAENKFYTTVQNAQIQVQTLDMLMKQKPGEAVGYVQAHKAEIITGKLGQSMLNRLGQVNSLQRTIQDSNAMEPDAKISALKSLHNFKMQMLSAFNAALESAKKR